MGGYTMSVFWRIPHQTRFLTPAMEFTALFNNPVLGAYSFQRAANQNRVVIELQPNSIYLIEQINIGGTVDELIYLNALSTVPRIEMKYGITRESVYTHPLFILQYYRSREIPSFIKSDKGGDALTMDIFTGELAQTADLVGIPSITLYVTLSIYQIDERGYNEGFRNTLKPEFGAGLRQ